MKILCVEGHLREMGNTARLMDKVKDTLRSRSVMLESVALCDRKIADCMDCGGCFETATCKIDDDMTILYEKVQDADAIIFSTPVYMWNMTGILKVFLDRLFCVTTKLEGKKAGLVMTAGGDHFDGADLCVDVMRRACDYTGMTLTRPLLRESDGADGYLKWDAAQLDTEIRKFVEELIY